MCNFTTKSGKQCMRAPNKDRCGRHAIAASSTASDCSMPIKAAPPVYHPADSGSGSESDSDYDESPCGDHVVESIQPSGCVDSKVFDLIGLLPHRMLTSLDGAMTIACALYTSDMKREDAMATYRAAMRAHCGLQYPPSKVRHRWDCDIPDMIKRMDEQHKPIPSIGMLASAAGGASAAEYSAWKRRYSQRKPKALTQRDIKDDEDAAYERLVESLIEAINAADGRSMHEECDSTFGDVCRLHRQVIDIADLAVLFARTWAPLMQRGKLYLIIREQITARCKVRHEYKQTTQFTVIDLMRDFDRTSTCEVILEDDEHVHACVQRLIKDVASGIKSYDSISFYPSAPGRDANVPSRVFNLFGGWIHRYDPEHKPDQRVVDAFVDMYKHILCAGDDISFQYEVRKLAHIIQHPEQKTEAISIYRGEQGVGKSFIMQFLMQYVIGQALSLSIFSPDQLLGRFNSHLAGKLFLLLEEAVDLGNPREMALLKGFVRSPTLLVEQKGLPIGLPVDCCMNFYACTNSDYSCMFREAGERTANLNEVSGIHKRDTAYFGHMSEVLNNYTAGCDIFHWLASMDIRDYNVRCVPETRAKADKKLESAPSFIRFLHRVLVDDLEQPVIDLSQVSDDHSLKIMSIHRMYASVCEDEFGMQERSRYISSKDAIKKLCSQLLPIVEHKRGRPEYVFTRASIAAALDRHFGCDSYSAGLARED